MYTDFVKSISLIEFGQCQGDPHWSSSEHPNRLHPVLGKYDTVAKSHGLEFYLFNNGIESFLCYMFSLTRSIWILHVYSDERVLEAELFILRKYCHENISSFLFINHSIVSPTNTRKEMYIIKVVFVVISDILCLIVCELLSKRYCGS